MKYDLLHLPGPPIGGCGQTYVDGRPGDGHQRGDRVTIRCGRCGSVGEHEVRARLTGLVNA